MKYYIFSLIFLLTLSLLPRMSQAQDAKAIVKKSEENLRGKSSRAELTMTIVRPKWSREMSMKSWQKGNDYALILVTGPARDKGVVYLKRSKEVWNWVPSIERNVKLPASMMSQSWMGSDFSNDDLVREMSIVNDYTHKILGTETIEGRDCHKIELIPSEEAAVVWGKIIMWIDKTDFLQLKSEFYDEDDYLVNVMEGTEVKKLGGRLMPTKLTMTPVEEEGQKTIMHYKDIEFDIRVEDSYFSTQNMKRVR